MTAKQRATLGGYLNQTVQGYLCWHSRCRRLSHKNTKPRLTTFRHCSSLNTMRFIRDVNVAPPTHVLRYRYQSSCYCAWVTWNLIPRHGRVKGVVNGPQERVDGGSTLTERTRTTKVIHVKRPYHHSCKLLLQSQFHLQRKADFRRLERKHTGFVPGEHGNGKIIFRKWDILQINQD